MIMAVDPKKWTIKTNEAVAAAIERAGAESHPEVTPDHLLSALLSQPEGVVLPLLTKVERPVASMRKDTEDAITKLPKAYGGSEPRMSKELTNTVANAEQYQKDLDAIGQLHAPTD